MIEWNNMAKPKQAKPNQPKPHEKKLIPIVFTTRKLKWLNLVDTMHD